jgi:hypothetical protein
VGQEGSLFIPASQSTAQSVTLPTIAAEDTRQLQSLMQMGRQRRHLRRVVAIIILKTTTNSFKDRLYLRTERKFSKTHRPVHSKVSCVLAMWMMMATPIFVWGVNASKHPTGPLSTLLLNDGDGNFTTLNYRSVW